METRICVLVFLLLTMMACNKSIPHYHINFPDNKKIDTVNLEYSSDMSGIYVNTQFLSNNSHFIFDSGSDFTVINQNYFQNENGKKIYGWDVYGKKISFGNVTVDTLQFGAISFINGDFYRTFPFKNYSGILGGDLISKFIWKFNFPSKKAYITRNINLFNTDDYQKIPLSIKGNLPLVELEINGSTFDFYIDFGYPGSISINNQTFDKLNLIDDEVVKWRQYPTDDSPFYDRSSIKIDTLNFFSSQIKINKKTIIQELIVNDSKRNNLLGLDFFYQFDNVIIDYKNQSLYLGKATHKSLSYLKNIQKNYNSLGIKVSDNYPPVISGISSSIDHDNINLGDTIHSIDGEEIFNKKPTFFTPIEEFQKITLVSKIDKKEKDTLISLGKSSKFERNLRVLKLKNNIQLNLIKNGRIEKFDLSRSYFLETPDTLQSYIWSPIIFENFDIFKSYSLIDTTGGIQKEKFIFLPQK